MIQQIVAWRNAVEHGLDGLADALLVTGRRGTSAWAFRFRAACRGRHTPRSFMVRNIDWIADSNSC